MQNNTPVVIVHFGNQNYVKKCLQETIRHNPGNVILIGNDSNEGMCKEIGAKHVHIDTIPVSMERQHFCDNFKNYSSNNHQFELLCFLRWYFMYEFMIAYDKDRIIHTDSDVALLCGSSVWENVKTGTFIAHEYDDKPFRMSNCIHTSVLTRNYIKSFIDLCHEVYVSKTKQHLITGKVDYHKTHAGGICDMTLTYLLNQQKMNISNLMDPSKGIGIIMNHIKTNEGDLGTGQYEMIDGLLTIYKTDNSHYLYDKIRMKYTLLQNIHFQGASKRLLDTHNISTLPNIKFINTI